MNDMKSNVFNRQLIVLGNGFDIQCGLKSTYQDFFNNRFKEVFGSINGDTVSYQDLQNKYLSIKATIDELQKENSRSKSINIFNRLKDRETMAGAKNVTRWDFYLIATNYLLHDGNTHILWRDVESDIYLIVTALLTHKYNSTNINVRSEEDDKNDNINKIEDFVQDITWLNGEEHNTNESTNGQYDEERAKELLNELIKFEKVFAKFIESQMNTQYFHNAKCILNDMYKLGHLQKEVRKISVLSFNYSIDKTQINSDSWSINNIHGIADYRGTVSPIFGIDNHDIVSLSKKNGVTQDPRVIFTKAYRVIDNDIDQIQEPIDFDNIKVISFYGHSLGEADYSYFETIFDDVDLYNSKVELEFYYYIKNDPVLDKREAIRKIENLLVNYGNQLDQVHGENIMNKLVLEKRIHIMPTVRLPYVKKLEEEKK